MSEWIVSHFPAHRVYCEPFMGAASVLMCKAPAPHAEIINELDNHITYYIMGPFVSADPDWPDNGKKCAYGQTDGDVFTAWRFAASSELESSLHKILDRLLTRCPDEAETEEVREARAALEKAASGVDATHPHVPLRGL